MINVILGVLPIILILAVYGWYTYKKKPIVWQKWAGLLGLGMVAAIIALILESVLIKNLLVTNELLESFLHAFIFVALIEESARFGMMWLSYQKKNWFKIPLDFIAAGLLISLGFSCLENLFYAYQYTWDTMLARTFTAVPAHAAFGVIMGYFLYRYHKSKSKIFLGMAILMPMLVHGIYDFFVIQNINETLLVGSLFTLALALGWAVYILVDIKKREFKPEFNAIKLQPINNEEE